MDITEAIISTVTSLGLHIGHDASCAVARDDAILAAVQQERISRRKHDGAFQLNDKMPIAAALGAQFDIKDIDAIVSCFQAGSPSGDGLGRAYIATNFEAFDPLDQRHFVVSHHFAHAFHAAAASGMEKCAVLVCDLGGSTTVDGQDYCLPYVDWHRAMRDISSATPVKTECVSFYRWERGQLDLIGREFVVPHNAPDVFVCSPASLYENVCAALFDGRPAYGELMALSAFGAGKSAPIALSDILEIDAERIVWKNGWQRHVQTSVRNFDTSAAIAHTIQTATETALVEYAMRACALAGSRYLAAAGGLFLNINSNSKIAAHCDRFFVPSAPHDAGISQGCAYYGLHLGHKGQRKAFREYRNDRLGPAFTLGGVQDELRKFEGLISVERYVADKICGTLLSNKIVARCAGRSEFGPRALGGRSLLASPHLASTKDTLNNIKGRQSWRPVAPIVLAERIEDFFEGPNWAPFMNFLHRVRPEWRHQLAALEHADGSTRAQSLERAADPDLHELISKFGEATGYPVLVNTSLNAGNSPIVESGTEAIRLFLSKRQIDCLILENLIIRRRSPWECEALFQKHLRLTPKTHVAILGNADGLQAQLSQDRSTMTISVEIAVLLLSLREGRTVRSVLESTGGSRSAEAAELYKFLELGFLQVSE